MSEVRNPKVSVFMRVFNKQDYLSNAIESILRQSYQSFELIIIDHSSTDASGTIMRDYAKYHSNVHVVSYPRSVPLPELCNQALRLARGLYIACLDADDIAESNRLELQRRFLDENPTVGLLGSAAKMIDSRGERIDDWNPPVDHDSLCSILLFTTCFAHSSMMGRVALLREIGGYNVDFRFAHDYDMFRRFRRVARLHCLSSQLVRRRINANSIHGKYLFSQRKLAIRISFEGLKEESGIEALNRNAFGRFWRVLHGAEHPRRLHPSDIHQLRPLWALILRNPAYRVWWVPRLEEFAQSLIRSSAVMQGLWLHYVLNKGLPKGYRSYKVRELLKRQIPGGLLRHGRALYGAARRACIS